MNVVFRVDASTEIGSGHVMRCLTLAEQLFKKGASIRFVSRDFPGHLGDLIMAKGFSLSLLSRPNALKTDIESTWLKVEWSRDVDETIKILNSKPELLVIDHYGIDANWHRKISSFVSKIMVIDDLANRNLECDIVLDQTFGRDKGDFQSFVRPDTQLLLGTKYALLREQFVNLRVQAIEKRKLYTGIKRILVSFGGADYNNNSAVVLEVLSSVKFKNNPVVDVVIGNNTENLNSLKNQAQNHPLRINILSNVKDMASLMLNADLSIGAGGSTSWERCTMALPTILIIDAENQYLAAHNLMNVGAVQLIEKKLGYQNKIASEVFDLDQYADKYHLSSDAASKICDGNGADKVASLLVGICRK